MTLLPYLSGAAAGVLNGLFGAGGCILLVPLLLRIHKLPAQKAFATSLAVTAALSAVSATVYGMRGQLDFLEALPYLLGGLMGGLIGGRVFKKLSVKWLRRVFALLILYGGLKALL